MLDLKLTCNLELTTLTLYRRTKVSQIEGGYVRCVRIVTALCSSSASRVSCSRGSRRWMDILQAFDDVIGIHSGFVCFYLAHHIVDVLSQTQRFLLLELLRPQCGTLMCILFVLLGKTKIGLSFGHGSNCF